MATFRLFFSGERAGPKLRRNLQGQAKRVREAMGRAAQAVGDRILVRGRRDIQGAGRFGTRWTEGFTATVRIADNGNVRLDVRHAVPYWSVFQYGKEIQGKPLLWIPMSFASDAQGVRARDFPGRLFRVDRIAGGAPLLLTADTRPAEVKYFGKESVTIPKKFHLVEIARDESRNLGQFYKHEMARRK